MSDKKPSDDTRRAIEGLLGKKSAGDSPDNHTKSPEQKGKSEESPEEDLKYVPFKLNEDDSESEEESLRLKSVDFEPKKSNQGGLVIAATILAIGLVTSFLIIAREDIANLFFNNGDESGIIDDQHNRIEELKAEIKSLKEGAGNSGSESMSANNLRTANQNLGALYEAEKLKNEVLRERVDELTKRIDAGETEQTVDSDRVELLERELASALQTIVEKENQLETLNSNTDQSSQRVVNLTRENSRLNSDLEDAKDEIETLRRQGRENSRLRNEKDSLSRQLRQSKSQLKMLQARQNDSEGQSGKLETVNKEYSRVLELLKESRDANNDKQAKLDQIMRENSDLRSEVSKLEQRLQRNRTSQGSTRRVSNNTIRTVDPVVKSIVRPNYPDSAVKRGVSGIVMLRILISSEGNVIDAQILSSPDPLKALDRAAMDAITRWKFEPARVDGRAVEVWHRVPLEFSLNRE